MPHTIYILGTDSGQCKELREILQERVADAIVTVGDQIPTIQQSDTIIIPGEDDNTNVFYRHLLYKLEDQVRRSQFLGELIRLFSSSLQLDEILGKVAAKSTEMLGDTSFIILNGDGKLRLEAAYSTDRERLINMLIATLPQIFAAHLLTGLFENGQSIVIEDLHQSAIAPEVQVLVEKYELLSLVATPIRTKEGILGAFVSISTVPQRLGEEDVAIATELSDFTAVALENSRLFAELQRSAITDSLTGVYNTRFFHEVLSREAALAHRYATGLSLLMIDVDSFKLVNDNFGHLVGNEVLTQIARTIEKTVRNTDFVFRCGGDEFGVVLPVTTIDGAMHVAEKILQKVASDQILQTLGHPGTLTVSIGVSEYQRGSHFETLVAEADQALYASKRSFKNCVKAFPRLGESAG